MEKGRFIKVSRNGKKKAFFGIIYSRRYNMKKKVEQKLKEKIKEMIETAPYEALESILKILLGGEEWLSFKRKLTKAK